MDTELNSYEYSLSDTGTWIVFCHGEPELYLKGKFVNVIRRACEEHRFYNTQAKEFGSIVKIEIEEV